MKKSLAVKVLVWLLAITAGLLVLHLLFQWLNLIHYHEKQGQIFELSNRFDVDDEASLPTWFSQFLLFLVSCAAFLTARLEAKKNLRWIWLIIAVGGILFSMDEVASIHELGLQTAFLLYYGNAVPTLVASAWWLVLPVIAILAGFFFWALYRFLPRRTFWLFLLAGSIFLIGAVGFEILGNDMVKTTFLYQGIMTGIEETLEMIGSIVALYAILDYLELHHANSLQKLKQSLRISTDA